MSIPKTMKAAVVNGINQPLSIKEVPVPEIKKGEVLLKVEACGVCHSDQHVLEGAFGEL
jgi:D-arabinose 1-dehydrogenase-like Zn-dependent alcohol dehydrogenase